MEEGQGKGHEMQSYMMLLYCISRDECVDNVYLITQQHMSLTILE